MDLHDYYDVAENYDLYLNELESHYSNDYENFYMSLARKYGNGGIIDIACGTGALTIPLAREFKVSAFDLSQPMVEVTKKKLAQHQLNANVFTANMVNFKAGEKFSLAIIARCGFMHLLTKSEQRQALLCIKSHLIDDGILTLNTFAPHPQIQAVQMNTKPDEFSFRTQYVNKEGKKEIIYNAITYDYLTQIMSGAWKFETLDENGNIIDTRIRPIAMRQTYRSEMEYLFEICGFEVIDVYNDFEKKPALNNFIWILQNK